MELNHPEVYELSRDEWLEINRVLAGCALAIQMPADPHHGLEGNRVKRLQDIEYARTIMSEVYMRAESKEPAP